MEQRSLLWVIGSCSEAVNQTRDWSSWLIDCTLWSKVQLVAGDQISHEKMLYSSWMNKAILAFLREDRGNGLVLDDSYPAVFLLLCQDVPLLISICRKNWSSSKGLARKVPDCSSYFLYETWQSVGTNDFFSGWGGKLIIRNHVNDAQLENREGVCLQLADASLKQSNWWSYVFVLIAKKII